MIRPDCEISVWVVMVVGSSLGAVGVSDGVEDVEEEEDVDANDDDDDGREEVVSSKGRDECGDDDEDDEVDAVEPEVASDLTRSTLSTEELVSSPPQRRVCFVSGG